MAETESAPVAAAPTKEKKTAKPKKASSHPTYNSMIEEAIEQLQEKGGSSRQAILKYMIKTHKVRSDNVSGSQLKLALRKGVASGKLKQSTGTGASGSFKLGDSKKKTEKPKKVLKKKVTKTTTKKSPKKVTKPKKSPAKKAKKPKVAKPAKKVAKSPKKVKKPAAKKSVKAKPKTAKKSKK